MKSSAPEKLEIIDLVEQSSLTVGRSRPSGVARLGLRAPMSVWAKPDGEEVHNGGPL